MIVFVLLVVANRFAKEALADANADLVHGRLILHPSPFILA